MLEFHCDNIVMGGDCNLILNTELDKQGGTAKTSHPKAFAEIGKAQINLDLGFVCRDQNPLTTRYTWGRRYPNISYHLDFFLISRSIYGKVTNSDILPGYKTDHSLITLNLGVTENPRGRVACFSKVPKVFRAYFGCHNSLYIFATPRFQATKLRNTLSFSYIKNMLKDQLFKMSRLQLDDWLFGPEKFSGLSKNRPLVCGNLTRPSWQM